MKDSLGTGIDGKVTLNETFQKRALSFLLDYDGDPKKSIGLCGDFEGDLLSDPTSMTCLFFEPTYYISMKKLWNSRMVGRRSNNVDIRITRRVDKIFKLQFKWSRMHQLTPKFSRTRFKKLKLRQIKKELRDVKDIADWDLLFLGSDYYSDRHTGLLCKPLSSHYPEGYVSIPPVWWNSDKKNVIITPPRPVNWANILSPSVTVTSMNFQPTNKTNH